MISFPSFVKLLEPEICVGIVCFFGLSKKKIGRFNVRGGREKIDERKGKMCSAVCLLVIGFAFCFYS